VAAELNKHDRVAAMVAKWIDRLPTFWRFQLAGWGVYLGRLVLLTAPSGKFRLDIFYRGPFLITCFLSTLVMHKVCKRLWDNKVRLAAKVGLLCIWCFGLGTICALISITTENTFADGSHQPFGSDAWLISLGTGINDAGTILLVWSAIYFGMKTRTAAEAERRRVLVAEVAVRDAELKALRYQVHPHFLFNTLNAISTLVVGEKLDAATRMIARLADFFRATLDEQQKDEVTLENELLLTEQYLAIERLRLGDRLSVTVSVESDTLSCLVPRLVLQPLVENAIRHGIAPRRGPGKLAISAMRNEEYLFLAVEDDGQGQKKRYQATDDSRGIGLTNTANRLRHLYGENYRFDLEWPDHNGCRAQVAIPAHLENAQMKAAKIRRVS
jgi:anti-sigma regulatory factor (Ser/Thr protein kinase)